MNIWSSSSRMTVRGSTLHKANAAAPMVTDVASDASSIMIALTSWLHIDRSSRLFYFAFTLLILSMYGTITFGSSVSGSKLWGCIWCWLVLSCGQSLPRTLMCFCSSLVCWLLCLSALLCWSTTIGALSFAFTPNIQASGKSRLIGLTQTQSQISPMSAKVHNQWKTWSCQRRKKRTTRKPKEPSLERRWNASLAPKMIKMTIMIRVFRNRICTQAWISLPMMKPVKSSRQGSKPRRSGDKRKL